jgi:hypothetical protein
VGIWQQDEISRKRYRTNFSAWKVRKGAVQEKFGRKVN